MSLLQFHGNASRFSPENSELIQAGVVSITTVKKGEETERSTSMEIVNRSAKKVELGSVGLPVGVQVGARHWREDIVLTVMKVIIALEAHRSLKINSEGEEIIPSTFPRTCNSSLPIKLARVGDMAQDILTVLFY